MSLAQVALGGALGASLRYGVNLALSRGGFPWHTLAVNVIGSAAVATGAVTSVASSANARGARRMERSGIEVGAG